MVVDRWYGHGPSFCLAVLVGATCIGCGTRDGGSTPNDSNRTSAEAPAAASDVSPASSMAVERHAQPDETVRQFLTALKGGDQPRATSMLTLKAQHEMSQSEAAIQPPGSSTAQFEVTRVEMLGDRQDGAHVLSSWTDTEEDGTVSTHQIVWILRQEAQGWAIAGFATRVFEDQPPLILNFEDPLDLQRKRTSVDAEIARRSEPQAVRQAARVGGETERR